MPEMMTKPASSREQLIEDANSEEALENQKTFREMMEMCDNDEIAPSKGLTVSKKDIVSEPDGNSINLQIIRPDSDVTGLPPVVVSVNECDPLRDEGIAFYQLLLSAGVSARCRQVMGTMHGTEIFPICCPDFSTDTARDLSAFCKGTG
jgi:acetyl esterase/lipase